MAERLKSHTKVQKKACKPGGCMVILRLRCFAKEVKKLPNIKSAIKRVKVNAKKNLRNRMVKSSTKTTVKKFEAAVASDLQQAPALLNASFSALDKAAAKGVLHKNAANRKKARLAKKLAKAAN